MPQHSAHQLDYLQQFKPLHKVLVGSIISFILFFLLPSGWLIEIKILTAWVTFALVYLFLSIYQIITYPVAAIQKRAQLEDGSKWFVRAMISLFILITLSTIILLFSNRKSVDLPSFIFYGLIFASTLFAWIMIHIFYTFHYAFFYYKKPSTPTLLFPGTEKPDYIDFTYFSFTIGCAFQVSDVATQTQSMRRVVLTHALISFCLNTFIVALMINIIGGLVK